MYGFELKSKVTILVAKEGTTTPEFKFIEASEWTIAVDGLFAIDAQDQKLSFKTSNELNDVKLTSAKSEDILNEVELTKLMTTYFKKYYDSQHGSKELKSDLPYANLFEYGTATIVMNERNKGFDIQIAAVTPTPSSE